MSDHALTIRDLMTDPELFGGQFGGESWAVWRALLAGFYGLELTEDELTHWQAVTGRENAPEAAHDELWLVVGRRGGKSFIAALIAIYEALFRDHESRLSPGEVATVLVIAADRKQARAIMRYTVGLLKSNPMTAAMIEREDRESIELRNRTVIEIGTASFRGTRGYTLAAVLCDEIAFWRSDDSANPDYEILSALRPGLATLDGKMIALSSPYARKGELYRHHQRFYGQDGPILVAQAESRTMNPKLPQRVIDEAMERDPAAARAEYLAEFRIDLEAFLDIDTLNRAVRDLPEVLPPDETIRYTAFVDPAGGGADGFALAIGHMDGKRMVVDFVTERVRANPAEVCAEYAKILNQYNVRQVHGDSYAGQWVENEFKRHGITYKRSKLNRSEIYLEALAHFQTGRVSIPPNEKMLRQFQNLERRTSRAGRDLIDHPRGLHDDLANACAGALALLHERENMIRPGSLKVYFGGREYFT